MLEIVQEEERLLVANQRSDAFVQRALLGLLHVERVCERRDELRRVGDVRERDERDTVQELGGEHPSELDHGPRLPDAAGACDRDHAMLARELGERSQIGAAAEQRRDGLGQVARQAREPLALALQRARIGHDEAVGRDGVELERPSDVLEPEAAEA